MSPNTRSTSLYVYLRFVAPDIDKDSGTELGVFHAFGTLRSEGKLYPYEEEQHDRVRAWFNEHLAKPARLTSSEPPFYRKQRKAISWFKDDAREHLAHIRSLVAILENHGVVVQMLKTERIGYITYEDEFQIVAEPFSDRDF
jgi:hypothetical protein